VLDALRDNTDMNRHFAAYINAKGDDSSSRASSPAPRKLTRSSRDLLLKHDTTLNLDDSLNQASNINLDSSLNQRSSLQLNASGTQDATLNLDESLKLDTPLKQEPVEEDSLTESATEDSQHAIKKQENKGNEGSGRVSEDEEPDLNESALPDGDDELNASNNRPSDDKKANTPDSTDENTV
jgi:hypothetical protein